MIPFAGCVMQPAQKLRKMIDNKQKILYNNKAFDGVQMVDVAQLVRAPGCGPGGRGFESHLSPHLYTLGCSQAVRHQTLTLASRRFESSQPSHVVASYYGLRLFLFKKVGTPYRCSSLFREKYRSHCLSPCKRGLFTAICSLTTFLDAIFSQGMGGFENGFYMFFFDIQVHLWYNLIKRGRFEWDYLIF